MKVLSEKKIRDIAARHLQRRQISAEQAMNVVSKPRLSRYDIFLSQTTRDAEIVLGVYLYLTENGYTVFCDWIEAHEVERSLVSPANAAFVRATMKVCDCLVFLDTDQANDSLWMCWELGWFDGNKGKICIAPVLQEPENYREREFLGLYPYLVIDGLGRPHVKRSVVTSPSGITVFESPSTRSFETWLCDSDPYLPRVAEAWHK